jgi:hypothetical protein
LGGLEISLLELRNLGMHTNVGEITVPRWKSQLWAHLELQREPPRACVYSIS